MFHGTYCWKMEADYPKQCIRCGRKLTLTRPKDLYRCGISKSVTLYLLRKIDLEMLLHLKIASGSFIYYVINVYVPWVTLWPGRHYLFRDRNSAMSLDMGTSWYFSLKLSYFGVLEWKEGPNSYTLSCPDCGMLKRPYFHLGIPK